MGKRAGMFAVVILVIVPVLVVGITLGGIFLLGDGQAGEVYEVFSRQKSGGHNVLLADRKGSAFMVCLPEEGNTRLISILPTARPKGEQNITFLSIYQKEGIGGLKQRIEKSLSCTIAGYLEVDFSGLASVVDALGGVKLEGKTYSGAQLQIYLQNLPCDSTGARVQQDTVLAVGRQFCAAGFWKGQNGLGKLLKISDTDLSISTLVQIGKKLIPALEGKGLYRYCLPEQGRWEMPDTVGAIV